MIPGRPRARIGAAAKLAAAVLLAAGCGSAAPTGSPPTAPPSAGAPDSASPSATPAATSRVLPGVPTATPSTGDPGIPADTDAAVPAATVWGQVDAVRLPIPLGGGRHFVFANAATPDGRYLIGTRQPDDFQPAGGHGKAGEAVLYGMPGGEVVAMATLSAPNSQVMSASADDRWVAWIEADDQPYFFNWRLRAYDRSTGRVRELARAELDAGQPLKGPLSFVAVSHGIAMWGQGLGGPATPGDMGHAVVRRAALESGAVSTVASSAGWPALSWPWAAWVVFDGDSAHVEVQNLETGASSRLEVRPSLLALDGDSLVYGDSDSAGIWLVDKVGDTGLGRLIARGPDKTAALEWPTLNPRVVAWAQNGTSIVYDRLLDRLVGLPVQNGWSSSTASGPLLVWEEMRPGAPVDQRWSDWVVAADTRSLRTAP